MFKGDSSSFWLAEQPIRCERLTNGVAGIIPPAIVPVFKKEWTRFIFVLVSVTTNKMQTADTNLRWCCRNHSSGWARFHLLLVSVTTNGVAGIIPRAIVHVFEGKEADEDNDTVYDIRVSYIEIYNEEIRYRELYRV